MYSEKNLKIVFCFHMNNPYLNLMHDVINVKCLISCSLLQTKNIKN